MWNVVLHFMFIKHFTKRFKMINTLILYKARDPATSNKPIIVWNSTLSQIMAKSEGMTNWLMSFLGE